MRRLRRRDAEDAALQVPEATLRTPSPISSAALDASCALLCTGLDNGSVLVWNNIFNTQHFCLKRHKGTASSTRTSGA